MNKIGLVIHGGAGTILRSEITAEKEAGYRKAMNESLLRGWNILKNGGTAIDAVTEAVVEMEDNELFNAGKGSVYTSEQKHEMDASIMDGSSLQCGCISMVNNVKNPILLAKLILEKSDFVYFTGKEAEAFGRIHNIIFEDDNYFHTEIRLKQLKKAQEKNISLLDHSSDKHGTVGACAVDINGNLAAATSSGGMTNKPPGRVGDSAIIGAGTYANTTCAVSCTGHGEFFMRSLSAFDLSCLMDYKKFSILEAGYEVINKISKLGGTGGLIAINNDANIIMPFNSPGMYRGYINNNEEKYIAIFKEDN